nr:DNA-directed RNA polymerase III subunit RPC3 [Zonotrichia albicollis]
MTQAELRLCSLLLREHFGEIVEKVGNSLLRTGPRPLRLLVGDTGLLPDQVRAAREEGILTYHGRWERNSEKRDLGEGNGIRDTVGWPIASPRPWKVGEKLLYPKKMGFGRGQWDQRYCGVADRLTETMEDGKSMDYAEVSNTFVRLADTHFIQRCPMAPEVPPDGKVPPAPALGIADKDMYAVPRLSLVGKGKRRRSCDEEEEGEHKAKRQKQEGGSSEAPPDDGIYWQVNLERFHQHFRDQALKSKFFSLQLEFVGKSGDSGGGTYTVNLHKALVSLATATLESIVEERFGSRCARIFRLLLRKKHLEQKQVEDFAMIPAKEAKDMLYRMLSENLVALQEIPKTPDHAPSRTFYLYTVNVMAAARMLLHRCYKSVANLMERRQHEMRENKRLLEKSQRVEAILASMQATGAEAAQLHEVEEMITGPERQQLESLKRNVNKIDASENQVDETIFVLESFIESTMKRP